MTSEYVPTAVEFRTAFLKSYNDVHSTLDVDEWLDVWRNRWNSLILKKPESGAAPGEGQQILAKTARSLRLQYEPGEPLRLDAAFYRTSRQFPIVVAIEHENNGNDNFWSEVERILLVRCRLKVAITYYTCSTQEKRSSFLEKIRRDIEERFRAISAEIGEDSRTEYLFLIGIEFERPNRLSWYSLDFSTENGPSGRTFLTVP